MHACCGVNAQVRDWVDRFEMLEAADVKLLVANKADRLSLTPGSAKQRPAWLLAVMDWCSESGKLNTKRG